MIMDRVKNFVLLASFGVSIIVFETFIYGVFGRYSDKLINGVIRAFDGTPIWSSSLVVGRVLSSVLAFVVYPFIIGLFAYMLVIFWRNRNED